jgi:AraC family transcriptional regulator of adaptative response/methylated-DNA-[protein]-cysteine methyltransferase
MTGNPEADPQRHPTEQDPRWAAIVTRDAAADGTFLYSVDTTGVYCHPSCASRLARPRNVRFHQDRAAAEGAGFRACKRCKPDQLRPAQRRAALVAALCRRIEARPDAPPVLAELAAAAGLGPSHLHRIFKAAIGITPRAYAAACRARDMSHRLATSATITEAIHDAGFGSTSRFYETSRQRLGMTPTARRAGGAGTEIRFAVGQCSLGAILVAASPVGVCAILLGEDPATLLRDLQDRFPRAALIGADPSFETLVARIVGLVETPGTGLDLPLDIRGTAFQQRVWQSLRAIPPGATASYAAIARDIGLPGSGRAVAGACAANALAVAIPCHRVVRSDGALSGYRWGIGRKRTLLDRERQAPPPASQG